MTIRETRPKSKKEGMWLKVKVQSLALGKMNLKYILFITCSCLHVTKYKCCILRTHP